MRPRGTAALPPCPSSIITDRGACLRMEPAPHLTAARWPRIKPERCSRKSRTADCRAGRTALPACPEALQRAHQTVWLSVLILHCPPLAVRDRQDARPTFHRIVPAKNNDVADEFDLERRSATRESSYCLVRGLKSTATFNFSLRESKRTTLRCSPKSDEKPDYSSSHAA